jgi:hypothetical protein
MKKKKLVRLRKCTRKILTQTCIVHETHGVESLVLSKERIGKHGITSGGVSGANALHVRDLLTCSRVHVERQDIVRCKQYKFFFFKFKYLKDVLQEATQSKLAVVVAEEES